jgi:cysteine desulfurase
VPAGKPPFIYLDYNAGAPLAPEARREILRCLDAGPGNPSSRHAGGQWARAEVERARETVAAFAGAAEGEVIFTGSGTEADNLALRGILASRPGAPLLISAVEHPAVLETARSLERSGHPLDIVPVDACGRVDPDEVERRLRPGTALASIMLANHEVGTLQPIEEIALRLGRRGVLLHVDAVQAAPYQPPSMARMGIDLLSLSAHKLGGPQGIGALVVRPGLDLEAQMTGGAQQQRRRAGTEAAALCAGFAAACRAAGGESAAARVRALRDHLEEEVRGAVPGVEVAGSRAERLPNTSCIVFDRLRGDLLVVALDLEGVCVSHGAACASGMARPSHVLTALGFSPEQARGAVRFSLGRQTTADEVAQALGATRSAVTRLRGAAAGAPA